ncbi:MAG: AAA family ATPase [Deltaproteobacteria bacterium]
MRSALAVQREIARFSERMKREKESPAIRMRIGIHSGPVVVGTLGNDLRVDFKAVGDTVNLASRMEGLAEPGATYVSEETFKQTEDLFCFEALGKKEVKGKEKAIPVYKLLFGKEDVYRPRLGSERMIYSEMVGRDKELDRLELQAMKAINGEGSIVNIIGEAGIGKSRLVAELKARDVMKHVTFLEGRAISMGRNLSFHPIIDFLKQWAQIRADDGEASAFRKLETAVRNLVPDTVGELLPFVATLMGMRLSGRYADRIRGIEGEALEKLILKNVRELLAQATEVTPLVIVAEDLHWADVSSIKLITYLFRLAETHRILFVNVFRAGHKETGDRITETIKEKFPKHYVEIQLEPLNEQISRMLIRNMLNRRGLHHAVVGQIVERAGGNPFFIEEVVRSFIDQGAVVQKDGRFEMTKKIRTMAIPYTINDVLTARIDRLENKTHNLVKVASVIGRNFFYRILKEVTGTPEDLDDILLYLKEMELVRERTRMGEKEYLFKHALAQEVAYESILPVKRKELHLKVADTIEKVFRENLHEFYGMLAYHYSRAENLETAEKYLIKAGEDALKSSASSEALHYFQEALALYLKQYGASADPEKVAMIEKNIALALYNRGQYDEALEYFDRALNHYWGPLPKNPVSAAYKFTLGFIHFLVSIYLPVFKYRRTPTVRDNESIDLFFKKLKILVVLNPKKFFIQSFYFNRRVTEFDLNQIESGPGILVGASSFFSFTGISFKLSAKLHDFLQNKVAEDDIKSLVVYDFCHTLHNYLEGNWGAIKDYDEDLMNKCLDMGEIYFAAQHLYWHACPKLCQGDFKASEQLAIKLNELFSIYLNEFPMLLKYLLTTSLLIESRRLHDALVEVKQGIEFGQKIRQGSILIEMYSRKAHIHILNDDIEEAENALTLADNVRAEIETVPWQLNDFFRSQFEIDLYHLATALRTNSKHEIYRYRIKAKQSARKLLKVARKGALIRTESYRLMGLYFWLINKQQNALKWWSRSINGGESLGAVPELARTYFEVGIRLLESQSKYTTLNDIWADKYIEKARALFEDRDLQWDIDKMVGLTKS